MASKIITAVNGQTLFDLALRYYGSAAGIINILEDNPAKYPSIHSQVLSGDQVLIGSDPINQDVVNYYESQNLLAVTGEQHPTGLDYVRFNETFILG